MEKEKVEKKKVFVALLNIGEVRAGLESSLQKWMREKTDKYTFNFFIRKEVPTSSNRNHIVKDFLAGDWDYLAMFDSDNYPIRNPFDLLDYDKDVIGMVYPGWGDNGLRFHVYKEVEQNGKYVFIQYPPEKRHGLMRVDAVATGGIFIKRGVLQGLIAPFNYQFDLDGVVTMSDDVNFCNSCNRAGFEIWVNWDYLSDHYKTISLLQVAELIIKAAESGIPKISDTVV